MNKPEYESLVPYCNSDVQLSMLEAYHKHGSSRRAAKALGCSKSSVNDALKRIKKNAARQGHSPNEDKQGLAPPGFFVKRKSTFYDLRSGEPVRQWIITEPEKEALWAALLDGMKAAAQDIDAVLPRKSSKEGASELLAIYPYGDPHIGMYAWQQDAEDDFDLNKATELFTEVTTQLVSSVAPADQALVVFLGDFFHSDDQTNRTRRSGHQLDVDSRWAKVLRVGVNIAVSLIQLALQKHNNVHVVVEIGNHDDHSAVMLATCLDAFFRLDPRITIDLSPARFHYYSFGRNLIGVHHGDLVKPNMLPGLMATDRPAEWGSSSHRVWYTGHIHNQRRYDLPGCQVESFRILPPRDAYTQNAGYRSGRSMDCIVRHKEKGEIARHTVNIITENHS